VLFYLGSLHKMHGQKRDASLFVDVLRDIMHMQVENLMIENLHYLLKAFTLSMEYEFLNDLKDPNALIKFIEEFLPRIINQTALELTRCNLSDVVMILESFFKLWSKSNFKNVEMTRVYDACSAYLDQYLGLAKKDITGSYFASLVEQIANAKSNGIYKFETKLIHRLQHIFINDHAELYNFSVGDLIKVLKGFETLNEYFNRDKVLGSIIELAMET
jgi:hypothetical protein